MGKTLRVLHGDKLIHEVVDCINLFFLIPNKTLIFPDTPYLFADPKYKYIMITPSPVITMITVICKPILRFYDQNGI